MEAFNTFKMLNIESKGIHGFSFDVNASHLSPISLIPSVSRQTAFKERL